MRETKTITSDVTIWVFYALLVIINLTVAIYIINKGALSMNGAILTVAGSILVALVGAIVVLVRDARASKLRHESLVNLIAALMDTTGVKRVGGTDLSKQHDEISSSIGKLNKRAEDEQRRTDILTGDIRRFSDAAQMISAFRDIVVQTNSENIELRRKVQELERRPADYKPASINKEPVPLATADRSYQDRNGTDIANDDDIER